MKLGIALGLLGALMGSTQIAHAQFGGAQPRSQHTSGTRELSVPMDVVFCVDGSGSMGGYLDQTKGLIRALVRELATSKGRVKVDVRVGLIQYGNRDKDYKVAPMTRDLDALLNQAEAMQADIGAVEWVGRVIQLAQQKMQWREGDVFRAIYVLGNESAEQGPVSYRQSALQALDSGIAVNAVQCEQVNIDVAGQNSGQTRGTDQRGATWLELAALGQGDYFHFAFKRDNAFDLQEQAAFSPPFRTGKAKPVARSSHRSVDERPHSEGTSTVRADPCARRAKRQIFRALWLQKDARCQQVVGGDFAGRVGCQ